MGLESTHEGILLRVASEDHLEVATTSDGHAVHRVARIFEDLLDRVERRLVAITPSQVGSANLVRPGTIVGSVQPARLVRGAVVGVGIGATALLAIQGTEQQSHAIPLVDDVEPLATRVNLLTDERVGARDTGQVAMNGKREANLTRIGMLPATLLAQAIELGRVVVVGMVAAGFRWRVHRELAELAIRVLAARNVNPAEKPGEARGSHRAGKLLHDALLHRRGELLSIRGADSRWVIRFRQDLGRLVRGEIEGGAVVAKVSRHHFIQQHIEASLVAGCLGAALQEAAVFRWQAWPVLLESLVHLIWHVLVDEMVVVHVVRIEVAMEQPVVEIAEFLFKSLLIQLPFVQAAEFLSEEVVNVLRLGHDG